MGYRTARYLEDVQMIEIGPNLTNMIELVVFIGAVCYGFWLLTK